METDTNPIDRSVAHLLFHRPSESPNLPPKPNVVSYIWFLALIITFKYTINATDSEIIIST